MPVPSALLHEWLGHSEWWQAQRRHCHWAPSHRWLGEIFCVCLAKSSIAIPTLSKIRQPEEIASVIVFIVEENARGNVKGKRTTTTTRKLVPANWEVYIKLSNGQRWTEMACLGRKVFTPLPPSHLAASFVCHCQLSSPPKSTDFLQTRDTSPSPQLCIQE